MQDTRMKSRHEPTVYQQVVQRVEWLKQNWASQSPDQCFTIVLQLADMIVSDKSHPLAQLDRNLPPPSEEALFRARKQMFDHLFKSALDSQNLTTNDIELMAQNAAKKAILRQESEELDKLHQHLVTGLKQFSE